MKKAVLLVNVGTPEKPTVKKVRKYLFEFLNDKRVIDLPFLLRKFLVNCIIVPFRAPKSTKLYQQLWTENGSPLLYYGNLVKEKLQNILDEPYKVFIAMRYAEPNLTKVLNEIKRQNFDEIILVPLFPQYASSTSGTVIEKFLSIVKDWNTTPAIKVIPPYYNTEQFINAYANRLKQYNLDEYDHIIFSYHGLPMRHIYKAHDGKNTCNNLTCVKQPGSGNKYCYLAACYETTHLLAKALNLEESGYTTSFQSRLSNNWLSPFTDKVIEEKAKSGTKSLLVATPSFVADCLETNIEIGEEYKEIFINTGGKKYTMAESLNDSDEWIETLKHLIV